MLGLARGLGVKDGVADVTLPMSVALFRATGPAMNVAVAFYVAHWLGYHPGLGAAIAATAVASVISYGAVSLPGEVSFISSIAPIAMALGYRSLRSRFWWPSRWCPTSSARSAT